MNWRFQVPEYLPQAVVKARYVPVDLRPGLDKVEGIKPAVRCKLTVGKEAEEFWLGQTEGGMTPVVVGDEEFLIGYNDQPIELGFELKLLRAEQTVDPGTRQPSSYSSYVQVTDPAQKVYGEDRFITMNQPLDHRGFKFFQTDLIPLGSGPNSSKPITMSGFAVSRDPGLWLKYIGSSMLALGIACMFYMKAYFFKPRGRKTPAPALSNGSPA
jgi:hypothetical protein